MLSLQKDGKCVKYTERVNHLSKITHSFSSPTGLIKLSLYSQPLEQQKFSEIFDISLPLPFGSKIHCYPVIFSWDQTSVLKTKDLEVLFKRLIDEQMNINENSYTKPYKFADTLNISSSNIVKDYESEDEEIDDDEIYEDESEEEEEDNQDQSSEDEEEEEFDDS